MGVEHDAGVEGQFEVSLDFVADVLVVAVGGSHQDLAGLQHLANRAGFGESVEGANIALQGPRERDRVC